MKKFSSLILLLTILITTGSSCLKDKQFEDQENGIQTNDIKAVAFPQASKSPVTIGITGQAAALTVPGPYITVESSNPASGNITVNLSIDQTAVTAEGLTPLPDGTFSLSASAVTIPKDSSYIDDLTINVINSDQLDPTITYGIGIKIASADQGYAVASNMSTVVIGFAIKNKYDGIYRLQGYHNRVPYTFPYDTQVELITVGPNSVIFYWPDVESNGHPIGISPTSTSWYGDAISPIIVFDPATGLVTDVYNNPPNATPITMFTGAGSRVSKYDPATRSITVDWNYNNNPLRAFFDDLTYISPRP